MKLLIILLATLFCYFLYPFLDFYIDRELSMSISATIYAIILVWILIKPKEDTFELKIYESDEEAEWYEPCNPKYLKIYESDVESWFAERMTKTRIASQKRKARKLTK